MTRKKMLLIFALLSAFSLFIVSCSENTGDKDGSDTNITENSTETDNIDASEPEEKEPEPVFDSETRGWTLETGNNAMTINIENNTAVIESFKTKATGDEWITAPEAIVLPTEFKNDAGEKFIAEWVFDGSYLSEYKGLVLKLQFSSGTLKYVITVNARTGNGPFEISGSVNNGGDAAVRISVNSFFNVTVNGDSELTAWSFKKESGQAEGMPDGQFDGTGIYTKLLKEGAQALVSTNVSNTWGENGFIPIVYLDCNGEKGFYAALEWPTGVIRSRNNNDDNASCGVTVTITLNSKFSTLIQAGSDFAIPSIYIGSYIGDVDDGSNIFKKWFFEYKAPACLRENEDEPFTQVDDQVDVNTIPLLEYGVQSLKWDYGWWSDDAPINGWMKTLEGDWKLRNSGYINKLAALGLTTIGEYGAMVKNLGYNFTVYFTLHDSESESSDALTSVGVNGHPEWFSDRKITTGYSADLGNVDCVNFIKETLLKTMNEFNATTWRCDFEPICLSSDKENRHDANGTDVQYWCALGLYEVIDYLYENKSDFRYENCGSGGSLKDYATMSRSVNINNDDSANYNGLRMSFYDSSYCLPPAQLELPCNPDTFCSESTYYQAPADIDYGMRSVMLGVPMFGSWSGTSSDGHLQYGLEEAYQKNLVMYQEKIKPLVKYANLYHILPRPDNINWDGVEYYNPDVTDGIKGCVFLFKPTDTEGSIKTIYFKGLDENTQYTLEFEDRPEQNTVKSGKELMENGLDVEITGDFGSEIIWIK